MNSGWKHNSYRHGPVVAVVGDKRAIRGVVSDGSGSSVAAACSPRRPLRQWRPIVSVEALRRWGDHNRITSLSTPNRALDLVSRGRVENARSTLTERGGANLEHRYGLNHVQRRPTDLKCTAATGGFSISARRATTRTCRVPEHCHGV